MSPPRALRCPWNQWNQDTSQSTLGPPMVVRVNHSSCSSDWPKGFERQETWIYHLSSIYPTSYIHYQVIKLWYTWSCLFVCLRRFLADSTVNYHYISPNIWAFFFPGIFFAADLRKVGRQKQRFFSVLIGWMTYLYLKTQIYLHQRLGILWTHEDSLSCLRRYLQRVVCIQLQ